MGITQINNDGLTIIAHYNTLNRNNMTKVETYKEMYLIDMPQLKQFKYIISVRKFEYIRSDSIPISGQICLNNKILAKIIFWYLRK